MSMILEPAAVAKENANVRQIGKQCKWLERLNTFLTITKGKGKPHRIITGEVLLEFKGLASVVAKITETNKHSASIQQYLSDIALYWLWTINKVVYHIPREVVDCVDVVDEGLGDVPLAPLLRTPQWCTYVALNWGNEEPDEKGKIQRGVYYGLTMIAGQEYLMVTIQYEIKGVILPMYAYFNTSAHTLRESFDLALHELQPLKTSEENWTVRLVDFDITIAGLINTILFINGEYHKSALGKSKRVWHGYQRLGETGYKLRPRVNTVWAPIGDEYLSAIRAANEVTVKTQRVAHVRRGHWHTYWTGPRSEEQTYIRHWLPPIVVSGRVKQDLPSL